MSRLFSRTRNAGEDSDGGIGAMHSVSKVRHMIGQCLNNSMYRNACTLADLLIQLPDSSTEDILLLGRCFHLSGESRRCLAVLEHHGVLAAEKISYLSSILTHNLQDEVSALMNNNSNEGESELAGLNFTLQVVHMAARCLYSLNQYEDCVNLLEPLLADGTNETTDNDLSDMMRNDKRTLMIARAQEFCYLSSSDSDEVNVVASIYCIAGRCFHFLENRPRATALLVNSLRIDGACLEALEYILENALLSAPEKKSLLDLVCLKDREWLHAHYRFQLLDDWSSFESNEEVKNEQAHFGRGGKQGGEYVYDMHLSAVYLINKAERLFDVQHFAEAYKLARQAYVLDPFDMRGLHVYIGSMVELGLKTELFYLSHELINTYPKNPTSWYSVGCYYWACRKLEHAQKYIQKVIKLDKRASRAWIILGHILAAQEESEHAISAFRSASRLLPGDHRPIVFMAKELVRTNHLSLGLHLLSSALKISPRDATVHNEIGVILLKQERLEEALHHLQLAASITYEATGAQDTKMRSSRACGDEVCITIPISITKIQWIHFNNYTDILFATTLLLLLLIGI